MCEIQWRLWCSDGSIWWKLLLWCIGSSAILADAVKIHFKKRTGWVHQNQWRKNGTWFILFYIWLLQPSYHISIIWPKPISNKIVSNKFFNCFTQAKTHLNYSAHSLWPAFKNFRTTRPLAQSVYIRST